MLYFLTSSCCLHLEGDSSHMCNCCSEEGRGGNHGNSLLFWLLTN